MKGDYVQITVHRDVLASAFFALADLTDELSPGVTDTSEIDGRLRAFLDLIDPLPEPDVNGYTPNIRYNVIPADFVFSAPQPWDNSGQQEWLDDYRDKLSRGDR